MVLNSMQISETITQLKQVLAEQQRILADTEKVVLGDLRCLGVPGPEGLCRRVRGHSGQCAQPGQRVD